MTRRAGKVRTGSTPATAALTAAGVPFVRHDYPHDPENTSYGEEMAAATGFPPEQVFKTLIAEVDGNLVVGVVPITGQLDLKALAAAVGGKRAAMADPALAERTTGYVRGGISPLGQRKQLTTVVDASARDRSSVCVSGGRRGLSIELAPADLVALTDARVAVIGRG